MATRTSSPARARNSSARGSGKGRPDGGTRPRPSGAQRRQQSRTRGGRSTGRGSSRSKRRPAARSGAGPFAAFMLGIGRGLVRLWLGFAHLVGGIVRGIGHGARELDPAHRRDGAGLTLIGLSVVVAAAIWWHLPGAAGDGVRVVVSGSVGVLGW